MSHLQSLIESRLNHPDLSLWLSARKSEGMSYREMAKCLKEETGITVSKSTIHYWIH